VGVGGSIRLVSGASKTCTSGDLYLSSANAGAEGSSGSVYLRTGTASTQSSGTVSISTGTSIQGSAGMISLAGGGGAPCWW
jgi:hypothetical protein